MPQEKALKSAVWENIFTGWRRHESQTVVTLKQVPVFQGLTSREWREIDTLIHQRFYKPGETVFRQYTPGEGMYVIMAGEVEISVANSQGHPNVLATLTDGDFFGELAFFDEEPRSATAVATTQTTLLGFFRPDLLSVVERHPELGTKLLMNLARVLAVRLRKTNDMLSQQDNV